jgi:hypothetical protein
MILINLPEFSGNIENATTISCAKTIILEAFHLKNILMGQELKIVFYLSHMKYVMGKYWFRLGKIKIVFFANFNVSPLYTLKT